MSGSLLICDETAPQPSRDTASLRMWRLILIARSEGWDIVFHPRLETTPGSSAERLRGEGVEVLGPDLDALATYLDASRAPDVALVSRPQVAERVMPMLLERAPEAALIYDTLDLAHLRAFRQAKATRNGSVMREAIRLKGLELELTRAADVTLVVSDVERAVLSEAVPEAELVVVPSIHVGSDRPPLPRDQRRPDLVLAAYWPQPANPPAARVLLDDVWPALAERDPDLRLVLIGTRPPDWMSEAAAASDGRVVVTGHVPDIAPFLDSAWCSVVPQSFGSGVKGKVLSPLAHGLPTVATSVAWEGIPIVDEVHGVVADDPEAMIDAVLRLRTDAELWNRLHAEGPRLIESHFSFAAARTAIRDALARARTRATARA
jgi:glycosyltransferase involved in cell wall biosynthesis